MKHGFAKKIPEYNSWISIKQRCYNKNCKDYKYYGKIGIIVCPEWKDNFLQFYKDMGQKPCGDYTIERIDVKGNYEPNNCKWATRKEQANNRTNNHIIAFNNQSLNISEWEEVTKIKQDTILSRLNNGWSIKDSLTKEISKISEMARQNGMKQQTLQKRLKRGWNLQKALNTPVRKVNN